MDRESYERGVRDAVRFCLTHIENYRTGHPENGGEELYPGSNTFVSMRPDRVKPGELLEGSARHRERRIEIVGNAALHVLEKG